MLKTRLFDADKDYKTVENWWKAHKWEPVPLDHLSPTGLIVFDETALYCASWLYLTNSKFAWLEFLVSNPQSPLRKRKAALELMVAAMLNQAKSLSVKSVFTSLANENLIKLYTEGGFVTADKNVTHLIARVN